MKATGGFSNIGEFMLKVKAAGEGRGVDSRLKALRTKTAGHMAEGEDSQGGFLVPTDYVQDIYQESLEEAIVRPRARHVKMIRDTARVPILYDTNRSSTLFGGISFSWLEEAADKASGISKPSLGKIKLSAHKGVATFYASNELQDDAVAFGDFVKKAFGAAVAFYEDEAFLWGNGAGQPLGAVNTLNGCLIPETRAGANDIDWIDIVKMAGRLLPASWKRAIWLVNPDTIVKWGEAIASAANTVNVLDMAGKDGDFMTLFGRPVIPTEKAETLGTQGDIILADFGNYVIGTRQLEVASSRETGFASDETFWRVVIRVDGQPILNSAMTPRKSSTTLSPFVVLAAGS